MIKITWINQMTGMTGSFADDWPYGIFRFRETFISEFYLILILKAVKMFGRFKRYHPHDTKSQIGTVLTNYLSHFLVYWRLLSVNKQIQTIFDDLSNLLLKDFTNRIDGMCPRGGNDPCIQRRWSWTPRRTETPSPTPGPGSTSSSAGSPGTGRGSEVSLLPITTALWTVDIGLG